MPSLWTDGSIRPLLSIVVRYLHANTGDGGITAIAPWQDSLGLLSDTDSLHWQHLRDHYPILSIFPRPILSFQVGTMKPDPEIFRRAARVGPDCP